ncbi:MAG TPA: DUF4293 domain-containing protein [Candidatus Sphingobacterium stercoripullorum]|uniref:DUF4293 domain-containing protein n=1 Tax=Candidatus Sphingobacterium stercoripullorum TaxID=2838759 RepID=A0A9D1WBL9_9SPHI|nr:DUF4293 domain-containing protein [Candidatus Sphingobacterium stercoripullorum]HLR51186.1 DUF4293 domain-containing protein [Candidatus Sphingobacterium stercoripullorum]
MIQRIQTVWLFLAGLFICGLFIFPYLNYMDLVGLGRKVYVTGVYSDANNEISKQDISKITFIFQTIYTVLIAAFPLYIIFLFKNRKKQIQFIILEIILIALLGLWLYATSSSLLVESNKYLSADNIGVGFFLLPISIIMLAMAMGGIRKDDKLIKSADRLRP